MPDQNHFQTSNDTIINQTSMPQSTSDKSSSAFEKPNEPGQSNSKKGGGLKSIALLEIGLFELLFVIGGLLIILGIFNYYNLLPVSQSFPFLSFLPQQQKTAENKTHITSVVQSREEVEKKIQDKIPFLGCPVKPEICKAAEIISDTTASQSSYWYLGYSKLSEGTPILAVMDGNIEVDKIEKNGENRYVLTLTNKDRLLKAYYEFKEGSFEKEDILGETASQGAILGVISNENIKMTERGNDYNFIFSLENNVNKNSKNYVQVKPSSDGKSLFYIGR